MRRVREITAVALSTLVLAGCGNDDGGGASDAGDCENAVAQAAEATNMPERKKLLRPAFTACQNLAEFAAAAAKFPDAFEGVDVEAFVREQCREVDALRDAGLCKAVG